MFSTGNTADRPGSPYLQQSLNSAEPKRQRAFLTAATRKLELDETKMKKAVDRWLVAEEEKNIREGVPFVFKWLSPRVSTVSPLIDAYKQVKDTEESCLGVQENISSNADSAQIAKHKLDEARSSLSRTLPLVFNAVIEKSSQNPAEWRRSYGWQFLFNQEEAPLSFAKQEELTQTAREAFDRRNHWDYSVDPLYFPERGLVRRKATWNVYTKIILNATLTTAGIAGAIYIAKNRWGSK